MLESLTPWSQAVTATEAAPQGKRVGIPATQPDLVGDMTEPTGPLVIVVDPEATAQRIDGFGGCFNEIGWRALLRLDEVDRERGMRALFDEKEGLGLNFGRVPIGASDFALSPYSLDDAAGDLEMKQFSIERDRYMLIPFIKAALKIRPDLKVWGSPWSPPGWMKTSGVYHGGTLRQEPETVGNEAERRQNTGPLLVGVRVDQVRVLRAFEPAVDLLRVRHPLD